MKQDRHNEIDFLRGLSIFVMVLIHTNAYFKWEKIAFYLWDYSQFAVPAFIFCSTYVFFKNQANNQWNGFKAYLKKRANRLLIPYYLFISIYLILTWIAEPKIISFRYLVNNLTLTGGIDLNWLVLLFFMLSMIMPLISYFRAKRKFLLYGFFLVSLLSSIILLFYRFPFSYKLIMWLPWSMVIFFGLYFVKFHQKKWFFPFTITTTLILYLLTRQLLSNYGSSLIMFDNKYPPNLYHLSYGFFVISFLFYLFSRGIFSFSPVRRSLIFLSFNSYSIFFIHFVYLYIFTVFIKNITSNWIIFFLIILTLSILTQWIINKIFTKPYFFSILKKAN